VQLLKPLAGALLTTEIAIPRMADALIAEFAKPTDAHD
jgi:hypothetical protein